MWGKMFLIKGKNIQQPNKKCGFHHMDFNGLFSIKETIVNTDLEKIVATQRNKIRLNLTCIFESMQINTI